MRDSQTSSKQLESYTHTNTHNRFTALLDFVRTTQVRWHQKGKRTNLDLLEQEIVSGSDISWAICKSAPWPRHITMLASHHSVFTGQMSFLPPNQQHQSTELESYSSTLLHCSMPQKLRQNTPFPMMTTDPHNIRPSLLISSQFLNLFRFSR